MKLTSTCHHLDAKDTDRRVLHENLQVPSVNFSEPTATFYWLKLLLPSNRLNDGRFESMFIHILEDKL
jgi:hypothetical protein